MKVYITCTNCNVPYTCTVQYSAVTRNYLMSWFRAKIAQGLERPVED